MDRILFLGNYFILKKNLSIVRMISINSKS